MTTSVVTILVTALSALLGAWAGARVALDRFKKERAHDAQLEWYKDAVRLLFNAGRELNAVLTRFEDGQLVAAEVGQMFMATAGESAEHAATGYLFASAVAIEALREASAAFGSIEDARQMTPDEHLVSMRRIESAYVAAAKKVAVEGRRHLGLDTLPTPEKGAR